MGTGAEFDRVVSVSDRATAYNVMAYTDCVSTGSGVLPDGYGDDRLMTLPLIGDVPDMRLGGHTAPGRTADGLRPAIRGYSAAHTVGANGE